MSKIKVVFKDQGQDFLSWTIEPHTDELYRIMGWGVVTDCQPFQSFYWVGKNVHEYRKLKKGSLVKHGNMNCEEMCDEVQSIKYPLIKVEVLND